MSLLLISSLLKQNITEMLQRIGAKRPKIFGTMDFAQAYHQAPLTLSAKKYT